MSSAVTATSLSSFTSQRRYSLGRLMNSSTMLLLVVIGTLIIVLALLILFHHNLNATKGYRLRSLEHARGQLLLEQEVLNMQIAKSQSLDALKNDPQVESMLKPKSPKYIRGEAAAEAKGVAVDNSIGGIEYNE